MTKSLTLVICLALLSVLVHGRTPIPTGCPASTASCKAGASLDISVHSNRYSQHSSSSSCHGKSSAYCRVFTSKSDSCRAYAGAVINSGCGHIDVSRYADCWAWAFVQAYAEAQGMISCFGSGSRACFRTKADGIGVACSTASVLVEILVNSGVYYNAQCSAQVSVAIDAIASAKASANAGGCVRNGFYAAKETSFQAQIKDVLAYAFASCWTHCDNNGIAAAEVSGGGGAEVVIDDTISSNTHFSTRGNNPRPRPPTRHRNPHYGQLGRHFNRGW